LRFGLALTPPRPARPFNRTHQLQALVEAAEQLEENGKLPHEVLESWSPAPAWGRSPEGRRGGRERWSYRLLADELRRWSVKPDEDRRELFMRMVFNAMVTNNDDHPRNHALLQTSAGWRLSPAYDIVPVPLVSQERRDLALEVGRFGRVGSLYNLLSDCGVFGLSTREAQALVDHMLHVVKRWREFFAKHNVEARSIEMLEHAILPDCFYRTEPIEPI
jgi:serine/threonine-protein kinase HipA